jgi:O-antigen/teichoic acid export membrane protein
LGKSIFSNWFALLVTAIVGVFLTPFMIHRLGALQYGLWILAGSFADYYGILDLGVRSAVFRFIARAWAANDRKKLDETFATSMAMCVSVSVFIVVLSVLLAPVLPHLLRFDSASGRMFPAVLIFLASSVAVTLPARLFGTYLTALARWDLYNIAGLTSTILRAIMIVVALSTGGGVLAVAIITASVALLSLTLHWCLVRRIDPALSYGFRLATRRTAREIMGFSFHSSLLSVGDSLRFYSDSLVIARFLSVASVTPFSIPAKLMEYFKQIVVAAGGPLLGRFTEFDGREDPVGQRHFFLRSTRVCALLSLFMGVLFVVDGKAFLRLWVGPELSFSYSILMVLLVGYVLALAQYPSLLILIARAEHRQIAAWNLVEGVANLILSVVWAQNYGLMGVAMGTAVPMVLSKIFIQPLYACRAAGISIGTYAKESLLKPAIFGALCLAVFELFLRPSDTSGIVGLGLFGLAQTAFASVAIYFIGLTPDERDRVGDAVLRSKAYAKVTAGNN